MRQGFGDRGALSDRGSGTTSPETIREWTHPPPRSGGITSLEKEVAPKATEDGLPQYEFAGDFL